MAKTINKIDQYEVLVEEDEYELQESVNDYLGNGWQPHGGLQVITKKTKTNCDRPLFIQAMVRSGCYN